ncbi:hypothetical protein [Phage toucan80]|nr:hypothetical protein [Phage toucan80]
MITASGSAGKRQRRARRRSTLRVFLWLYLLHGLAPPCGAPSHRSYFVSFSGFCLFWLTVFYSPLAFPTLPISALILRWISAFPRSWIAIHKSRLNWLTLSV